MAFVVENGTGLSTATSYTTEAFADAFFSERRAAENTAWGSVASKEINLIVGSAALDTLFGTCWRGRRLDREQSLDWPRVDVVDRDEFYVDSNSVPNAIQRAVCLLALAAESESLIPDLTDPGDIREIESKIGPLSERILYAGGGNAPTKEYTEVEKLLASAGLVWPPGTLIRG